MGVGNRGSDGVIQFVVTAVVVYFFVWCVVLGAWVVVFVFVYCFVDGGCVFCCRCCCFILFVVYLI